MLGGPAPYWLSWESGWHSSHCSPTFITRTTRHGSRPSSRPTTSTRSPTVRQSFSYRSSGSRGDDADMIWQAEADLRFKIVGGGIYVPGSRAGRERPSVVPPLRSQWFWVSPAPRLCSRADEPATARRTTQSRQLEGRRGGHGADAKRGEGHHSHESGAGRDLSGNGRSPLVDRHRPRRLDRPPRGVDLFRGSGW